jgi:hypothetical protein
MGPWFHTIILATGLAATVAVGFASASMFIGGNAAALRADRLPLVANASDYVTIETRHDGISVLTRIHVN